MSARRNRGLPGGAIATDDRASTALTGLGALLAAGAGWLAAGTPGALAGGALLAAWLVAPPVAVLALGHVAFAALLPADPALATVAVVEGALLVVFAGCVVDARSPLRTAALGVAFLVPLVALVALGLRALADLWLVGALLAAVVALASYGLHRYAVFALEVADEF